MKRKIAVSIGIVLTLALAVIRMARVFRFRPRQRTAAALEPRRNRRGDAALRRHGRALVLAWTILEDDRPLRLESCLVWRELEDGDGYSLAHLCSQSV